MKGEMYHFYITIAPPHGLAKTNRARIYQASREFMKFTPTFKLKYKSKLSNFLKLRITLTLPVI